MAWTFFDYAKGLLYTRSQGQWSTQIQHFYCQKFEISPKGFTLGVKSEIKKIK
jgi:hypothetical protein